MILSDHHIISTKIDFFDSIGQLLPFVPASAISNPVRSTPDSGHAEDRQLQWCFVPTAAQAPGRQFERTFSDDFRAGVGASRPNRQGGGDLFVPNVQEPHFKGA